MSQPIRSFVARRCIISLRLLLLAALLTGCATQPTTPGDIKLISEPPLQYPPSAYEGGIETTVRAQIEIDARGRVTNVRIVSPPAPVFDALIIAAAKQGQYRPLVDAAGKAQATSVERSWRFDIAAETLTAWRQERPRTAAPESPPEKRPGALKSEKDPPAAAPPPPPLAPGAAIFASARPVSAPADITTCMGSGKDFDQALANFRALCGKLWLSDEYEKASAARCNGGGWFAVVTGKVTTPENKEPQRYARLTCAEASREAALGHALKLFLALAAAKAPEPGMELAIDFGRVSGREVSNPAADPQHNTDANLCHAEFATPDHITARRTDSESQSECAGPIPWGVL